MDLKYYFEKENEKPLDNIPLDGGFASIFRSVGFVGDSLSSGEFEANDDEHHTIYLDFYDQSWGQYMARKAGFKAYNFSRGGMTASEYCKKFADSIDAWNPEKKCQAYVIALGVNDLINANQDLGDVSTDICDEDYTKNAKTFIGYYAQIIQRLKTIQPDARFFYMTMPRENDDERVIKIKEDLQRELYKLAEHFSNSYVLDFYKYAPVYDAEFKKRFYLRGHMNAMGYKLTADMTLAYIDYIVRNNWEDFRKAGLIGSPFYQY